MNKYIQEYHKSLSMSASQVRTVAVDNSGITQNLECRVVEFDQSPGSDLFVYKENTLINFPLSYSAREQKIISFTVGVIQDLDVQFTPVLVSTRDIAHILGVKPDGLYRDIKDIQEALKRPVPLPIIKNNRITLDTFPFFSVVNYKESYFVFHINGQLGAFLLALPEKAGKPLVGNHKLSYTKYPLKYFVQLKSKHTLRLYELLSQYVYKGSIDFNYGDLCRILKTEGMIGRFKYFNRDILLDARDTINELTNLRCEFSLEKHRKSDIILHFDVKDNIPLADIKSLKDELSWLGVSEVGIDYILEKKCIAFDVISNNIKYVTKVIEENNGIRNVGAFLYTAINNNYAGKFKESGASAVKKFIKSTEMVHNSSGFERLGRLSEEYRDEVKRVIKTCLEGKQAKEVLQTYVLSDSSNFLREYVKRHFDMKTVTIDDLLSSQIIYIKIKHYLNENKIVHIESQGDFMKRKGETVDELYLLENGLA